MLMNKVAADDTRAARPIEYIPHARIPWVGSRPRNVILLSCDAFGVLPLASRLSLAQMMYHLIGGYTAPVARTEEGVKEQQATFSACFGAAFIMLHPTNYAATLAEKMQPRGATGWLVKTGCAAQGIVLNYLIPEESSMQYILGLFWRQTTHKTKCLNFEISTEIEGVHAEILQSRKHRLFEKKFEGFMDHKIGEDNNLTEEILAAGPVV